jgi:phospholipid N-methyltransferase
LGDGGYFTTFAYLQGLLLPAGQRFKKLLNKSFRQVTVSRVIWANVPPAIVYRCKK